MTFLNKPFVFNNILELNKYIESLVIKRLSYIIVYPLKIGINASILKKLGKSTFKIEIWKYNDLYLKVIKNNVIFAFKKLGLNESHETKPIKI
ncbi:hypothetical protein CWI39_0008p0010 [Hamiltosporidium magnivora]|uniref:Uncharacterized protein n=1 Tax=Hamiltosporidium magnivora TaxID=148818 RepID=A0A4Q9LNJ9_9MICR|nr:hypothetical protein CWI39_0008p0010 [Hamiltosporidium magnivora]